MVWDMCHRIVGPTSFDTNLNAEMYLNMFPRHDHAMPAKRGWRISDIFLARWGITSLRYLHVAMVGSAVSRFLDWSVVLWNGLRGPQISAHLIFTCGDT
jgi:hypothetical protein